jgi:hypothetical protein
LPRVGVSFGQAPENDARKIPAAQLSQNEFYSIRRSGCWHEPRLPFGTNCG